MYLARLEMAARLVARHRPIGAAPPPEGPVRWHGQLHPLWFPLRPGATSPAGVGRRPAAHVKANVLSARWPGARRRSSRTSSPPSMQQALRERQGRPIVGNASTRCGQEGTRHLGDRHSRPAPQDRLRRRRGEVDSRADEPDVLSRPARLQDCLPSRRQAPGPPAPRSSSPPGAWLHARAEQPRCGGSQRPARRSPRPCSPRSSATSRPVTPEPVGWKCYSTGAASSAPAVAAPVTSPASTRPYFSIRKRSR